MLTAIIQVLTGALGSFGFAMLFNVRGKNLPVTFLGGALSWVFYLLFALTGISDIWCCLLASVIVSVYAEFCARLLRAPTTVFQVPCVIPLIPGSGLYYTMFCAVNGDSAGFFSTGGHTLLTAVAIASGTIIVSTVVHASDAWRELKMGRGK